MDSIEYNDYTNLKNLRISIEAFNDTYDTKNEDKFSKEFISEIRAVIDKHIALVNGTELYKKGL